MFGGKAQKEKQQLLEMKVEGFTSDLNRLSERSSGAVGQATQDLRGFTEATAAQLRKEISGTSLSHERRCDDLETLMQSGLAELGARIDESRGEFADFKEMMQDSVAALGARTDESVKNLCRQLLAEVEAKRARSDAQDKALGMDIEKAASELATCVEAASADVKAVRASVDVVSTDIDIVKAHVDDVRKELEDKIESSVAAQSKVHEEHEGSPPEASAAMFGSKAQKERQDALEQKVDDVSGGLTKLSEESSNAVGRAVQETREYTEATAEQLRKEVGEQFSSFQQKLVGLMELMQNNVAAVDARIDKCVGDMGRELRAEIEAEKARSDAQDEALDMDIKKAARDAAANVEAVRADLEAAFRANVDVVRDEVAAVRAHVNDVRKELEAEMESAAAAHREVHAKHESVHGEIMAQLRVLEDLLRQQASEYFDDLRTEVGRIEQNISSNFEDVRKEAGRMERAVTSDIEDIRQDASRMERDMQTEIASLRKETSALRKDTSADIAALCEDARRMDVDISSLREEANRMDTKFVSDVQLLRNEASRMESDVASDLENLRSETDRVETTLTGNVESLRASADRRLSSLDHATMELQDLLKQQAREANRIEKDATNNLDSFRDTANRRFADLDQATTELQDTTLAGANASEVGANALARRVDWIVTKATEQLRLAQPTETMSLLSPKFSVAGLYDLQFELRLFRRSDSPFAPEDLAGDCMLCLRLPAGVEISCTLAVGNKSVTVDKGSGERVPAGIKRVCFLREQVNMREDTLRINLEIHEVVVKVQKSTTQRLEDCDGTAAKPDEDNSNVLDGELTFHRHTNTAIMSQVRCYLESMRARMVRRCEWKLERVSIMSKGFPKGEALSSCPFNAAGIEGFKLVFYPSGYSTAMDGFCSLFLYAPAGATVKGTLQAGSQKREISHHWETDSAFGRANFCRFDTLLNSDTEAGDSLVLALDIQDARQDLRKTLTHRAPAPQHVDESGGGSATSFQSVVKLSCAPGKVLGLEDVRVLPSLWTATPPGVYGDCRMDGYHTFDDMRTPALAESMRTTASFPRSESSPSFRDGYPAAGDAPSPSRTPLPQLAKNKGNDIISDGLSPVKHKKPGSGRGVHKSMLGTFPSLTTFSAPGVSS